uniref:Uncharacterized protein n=1 Tax=Kalanchoe fedtschenkoi TaxID=63787 RepID=A0A7N0TZS8_KALFE
MARTRLCKRWPRRGGKAVHRQRLQCGGKDVQGAARRLWSVTKVRTVREVKRDSGGADIWICVGYYVNLVLMKTLLGGHKSDGEYKSGLSSTNYAYQFYSFGKSSSKFFFQGSSDPPGLTVDPPLLVVLRNLKEEPNKAIVHK